MRLDGTLTKWNDDRGFGFIAPRQGGAEVFVHVSSFPRDGQRPRAGDLLTFEIEIAPDGRKRAKAASRPIRIGAPRPREQRPSREGRGMRKRILPLVVVAALAAYGYREYAARAPLAPGLAHGL